MSQLAFELLAIFIEHAQHAYTGDYARGYLPQWTLGEEIGGDIEAVTVKINPQNEYERALRELIDLGIVEEMKELPCRFRLVVKEQRS